MRGPFKYFNLLLFAAFLTLAAASALGYWFRVQTSELDVDRAVAIQMSEPALFGSILTQWRVYKDAMYQRQAPEIVVMGTSRSQIFRDYFFTRPFYNLAGAAPGGAIAYPTDVREVVQSIAARNPFRYGIVIADYWRFAKPRGTAPKRKRRVPLLYGVVPDGLPTRPLLLPFEHLRTGRIGWPEFGRIIFGRIPGKIGDVRLIGKIAVLEQRGVLRDGSTFDYRAGPLAHRFRASLDALDGRTSLISFRRGYDLDTGAVREWADMVRELEQKGFLIVTVAAPLAPAVDRTMRTLGEEFAFVDDWRREMAANVPRFFDMHDSRAYGATDCEFLDGTHPGEIANARMMLHVAEQAPNDIGRLINTQRLSALVRDWAGYVVAPGNAVTRSFERLIETSQAAECR